MNTYWSKNVLLASSLLMFNLFVNATLFLRNVTLLFYSPAWKQSRFTLTFITIISKLLPGVNLCVHSSNPDKPLYYTHLHTLANTLHMGSTSPIGSTRKCKSHLKATSLFFGKLTPTHKAARQFFSELLVYWTVKHLISSIHCCLHLVAYCVSSLLRSTALPCNAA